MYGPHEGRPLHTHDSISTVQIETREGAERVGVVVRRTLFENPYPI